ncbi:SpoIIE family protein phosphatase [Bacteroidota bacterium]
MLNVFKQKIAAKILILLASVAIIAVGIVGLISYSSAKDSLGKEYFNKLTAVREMKASQIEDYFKLIRDQITTFSEDKMIIQAMKEFYSGFNSLESEYKLSIDQIDRLNEKNEDYFNNKFLPRLYKNIIDKNYFPLSNDELSEVENLWSGLQSSDDQVPGKIPFQRMDPKEISGKIQVGGSYTVRNFVQRMIEKLQDEGSRADVKYTVTGTSAGIKKFADDKELDLVAAGRKISVYEIAEWKENGLEPIEFHIGNDALIFFVSKKNNFISDLTKEKIIKIFTEAEYWSDVNPNWPASRIKRILPGETSSSMTFFLSQLAPFSDTSNIKKLDHIYNDDGNKLIQSVKDDPDAIGFASNSFIAAKTDSIKSLTFDGQDITRNYIKYDPYPFYRELYLYTDKNYFQQNNALSLFLNYIISNLRSEFGNVLEERNYWDNDLHTKLLQNSYISSNVNEVGEKHLLDYADERSTYNKVHKKYHPIIRSYLEKFGYYDIFLVDSKTGHIIYSVFKEVDFATSLLDGPFKNTNSARAFIAANNSKNKDFVKLVDFENYLPSYDAPASFIASPIFEGNEKIGVLIFQMPIDKINNIMTNNEKWREVGLGETGETYLVGEDYKIRNQSRFLIEDRQNYFEMIKKSGLSASAINKIQNLNSAIGLQFIKTPGTISALKGNTGTKIFPDYRNVSVLSSYKPLTISDVNWAIISEMDEDEAFASVYSLRDKILTWLGIIICFIVVVGFLFSKTITRPIEQLANEAEELAKGNLDLEIKVSGKDEIGELAGNFDTMRQSIKKLVGELEYINANLEEKVEERTLELEQASEQIRTLVEVAPDGIVMIDARQTIVMFNPACEKVFGYKAEEVIGTSLLQLLPENSRSIHQEEIDKFKVEKIKSRMLDSRREIAGRRKDGTLFPAEAGISKMKINEEFYFIAFVRDITIRKEVESKLKLQSTALESAANGIVITSPAGEIQWVNHAFTKLTGYTYNDSIGKSPKILKSGNHDSGFYKAMWETITSGKAWFGEIVNRHKDGSLYTEEMTITPVMNEKNEIVNFIAIKQDISKRKKLEQELEKANERMTEELNVGRKIQMSMVPLIFPAFPETKEFAVYGNLHPAREVGGDFYDFFFIDDSHFCLCVGDVSGKGVPAALFMAVTKTLIKSRASDDISPASVMTHVNDELSEDNNANMFVTVFLAIININSGETIYTNAGHNPPYIKRYDGSIQKIAERHGPVIGALDGIKFKENRLKLDLGDILLVYTDGVTEAMDINDNLYSEKRLEKLLLEKKFESVEDLVKKTVESVKEFEGEAEQADDITILGFKFFAPLDNTIDEKLNISIKNHVSEIDTVNDQFNKFAEENDLEQNLMFKINMVFDELINNIVTYGYSGDTEHDIEINIEKNKSRLTITLIDDGVPFNPFRAEAPDTELSIDQRKIGGLGIHLVRNVMDKVSYHRRIDKNIVTLVKLL